MIRHPFFFVLSFFLLFAGTGATSQTITTQTTSDEREDVIWTGDISEGWDDPLNWNTSTVPGQNSNVTIPESPSGGSFPVIYSSAQAECRDLNIASGSSLRIRGFLTVYGQLVNTDETALTILSDEAGTGSLIFSSENVVATVQRYLSDGVNHFIGAPVEGATANDLFFNDDPTVYLYRYNESSGDWATIADLNAPLIPGLGYSVYVSAADGKQNVTANFSGVIESANTQLSGSLLTYTDESPYPGYNLISNPFTSALSWDLGNWQADKVSGCIWLWNGSYNYLFRNAHGMGSLSGGIIPSAQAFMVKATDDNPSLTLSADDRVHSSQNFYKPAGRDDEQYLVMSVQHQEKTDEVWVSFCTDCTDGYDTGWDTEKLFGIREAPQVYLMENDGKFSIDAGPPLEDSETRTYQLNFEAGLPGQHEFILTEVETGEKEGFFVVLKDLLEGTEQLMHLDEAYVFDADTTDDPERFQLEVSKESTGINDVAITEDYLIYSFDRNVVIKPLHPSSGSTLMIQIIDLFGRNLEQLEIQEEDRIMLPVRAHNTYVIVRLVTGNTVITKKLFIH